MTTHESQHQPSLDRLSVVIVSLIGGETLRMCLEQLPVAELEIIVSLRGKEGLTAWQNAFPAIKFLSDTDLTVPQRRAKAAKEATRDLVAMLEDTSRPDPTWGRATLEAMEDLDVGAAGGPVSISSRLPARFEALGWTEYGRFHINRAVALADSSGRIGSANLMKVNLVPGNNMVYRRVFLETHLSAHRDGLFEFNTGSDLLEQGKSIIFSRGMSVVYDAIDERNAKLSMRAQHGRLFASSRIAKQNVLHRATWIAKSLVLPAALSLRTLRNANAASKARLKLSTMVWIVLMESAWGFGEFLGYTFGRGRSYESWR